MSCDRFKEELFDYLGFDSLPDNIEEHLKNCPECRTFWSELSSYGEHLGSDEMFQPEKIIADDFLWEVNVRIDEFEGNKKETPVKLFNYLLPVAASIIILLGISMSTDYLNNSEPDIINNFSGDLYFEIGNYLEADDDEMEGRFVDELLNDYSASVTNAPSEQLLDDLTDEEMEYLKENFNAGDILL